MELPSVKEQIEARQKAIADNEEKIRQATKDNHWHRKYIRLLQQQVEEDKEAPASETLKEVSEKLK